MDRRFSTYVLLTLALILLTVFSYFSLTGFYQTGVYQKSDYSSLQQQQQSKQYGESLRTTQLDLRKAKLCVLNEILTSTDRVWPRLHQIVNNCSFVHRALKRPFIPFTTDKLFTPFVSFPEDGGCNVVTLGVGGEIVMETQLKKLYPVCKFYGADPFPQTAKKYLDVGSVHITAVDAASGERELHTLNGINYTWRKVNVTSLGSFLKNTLKINVVHYLSMDIEGSEYRLMPYLASTGLFAEESDSTTVCQISAEFHGPLPFYNYTDGQFEKILVNFLSASPFAPLKAYAPGHHHRIFFTNIENEYCLRLFY